MFDAVDRDVLKLENLRMQFEWFASYLSNKIKCIKCDGMFSDFVIVTKGVPQGSVLGPLLSVIHINDARLNMSDTTCIFMMTTQSFLVVDLVLLRP